MHFADDIRADFFSISLNTRNKTGVNLFTTANWVKVVLSLLYPIPPIKIGEFHPIDDSRSLTTKYGQGSHYFKILTGLPIFGHISQIYTEIFDRIF